MNIQNTAVETMSIPVFTFKGVPITSGKRMTPLKILIYGYNGVGKSTFASQSKNPIFIDLEGNIDHLNVPRYPISNLKDFISIIECLTTQEHEFKTIVIDSVDMLESISYEHVKKNTFDKKELTYGKDMARTRDEMRICLEKLDHLRHSRKMSVILIAHSTVRRCENPLTKVYDKYELRMNEKISGIICDWAQCILFAVNDVNFEQKEDLGFNKKRERVSQSDRRVLYTVGNTAYTAKNVFNLPHKMNLDWDEFAQGVKKFFSE